ncbi:MAG: hypothetical protein IKI76_09305 [Selenomonadaceae bacterium]|nr:hypothetical protein [Selenomonadaceae bacterium]
MAASDGKTLEKLYLELGLDLSQLQADILAADKTVTENLGRINRERNTIKLRVEADVAALDAVKNATQILEIQERGLNQQLTLSRDKLAILEAAYKQVAANKNSTAMAVQRAEQAFLKEKAAVGKLEQQLKSLAAQKISLDTSHLQNSIAQLNARIQHIRIQAEIDTSKLTGATAVFDTQKTHIAAVTKELDLQRQKLIQLREAMYQSARNTGGDSVQTLNIKSNVLEQIRQITQLETRLKELQGTNINLQIRADSLKQVEATVSEKIAQINARIENIRVKTEIDVSKLGAAASEFDKAKAHVQGLNRELDLQNQKLAEMKRALGASVSANGLNNVKTINLQTEIQKQIQAIDQLKAKIDELNRIKPPKTNNLLSGYLNIKGDVANKLNQITSAFNGIRDASQSADGAITKSLEIIGAIPHPAGRAVAALAAIPLVIKGIENSLLEMAKPAIAGGDSFYVMSRGMQLSVADMGKLSTIAKVTGIEISEVNNSLRRFSMQMTKADEGNVAAQVMKRYGAEVTDANGRIKNAIELSAELGKALKAAQAEGNGAAFRNLVGGKFWSADFITYLEDFADNVEQAKKVVKNGLANPTWAHSIQGEINTLNAQTAQLGGAFSAALMPVVAEIVPRATERFGELTKVIAANKENIKFLGDAMAVPVRMLNELTDGVISLSKAIDEAKDKGTTLGKMFEKWGQERDDLSALMNVAPMTAFYALTSPIQNSTDLAIAKYRKEIDEFKKARAEAEKAAKEKNDAKQAQMESSFGLSGLSIEQSQKLEGTETRLNEERIKREQETADIIYKINHSSYENSLHDLERWKDEQLRIITETEELIKNVTGQDVTLEDERGAVDDNYAAKQIQIEEEKEAKLAEIRQRIESADKTAIENRMIEIEDEKDAWIKVGMEKVEAEKLAQQSLNSYIKNIEQELSDSINSLHQNDLQKRLAQIEKEKQAWIDKGASEAQAEQLAQEQIRQAHEETEATLNEIRDSVAALDRTDLENKLANIEKERQAWIQKGMDEVEAAELAQKKIDKAYQEAQEDRAKAIAKAYEDAAKKYQAAMEEAERKNKALRDEALNTLKQEAEEFAVFLKEGYEGLLKLIQKKSGISPELAKQMTPENLEAYKEAKEKATNSLLPNWKDIFSADSVPVELPENLYATSDASKEAAQQLDNLAESTKATADSIRAYKKPDGSIEITNKERPQDGELIAEYISSLPIKTYIKPDGSTEITNMAQPKDSELVAEAFNSVAKATETVEQNLEDFGKQVQQTAEQVSSVPQVDESYGVPEYDYDFNRPVAYEDASIDTSGLQNSFGELETAVQGATEKISEMEVPEFDAPTYEEASVDTSTLQNSFEELETAMQGTTESFSGLETAVQSVTEKLFELEMAQTNTPVYEETPLDTSGLQISLGELNTAVQGATGTFSAVPTSIEPSLQNFVQLFSIAGTGIQEVTVRISELSAALANFSLPQANAQQPQEVKNISVDTSVEIQEAHAWDYDHIQELAEQVADIIEPKILSAIGGDSFAY